MKYTLFIKIILWWATFNILLIAKEYFIVGWNWGCVGITALIVIHLHIALINYQDTAINEAR